MGNLKKRFLMNYVEDGAYTRLPKEYQEVEYIESSGTQYIDTGVVPTNPYTINVEGEIASTPTVADTILGAISNNYDYRSGIVVTSSDVRGYFGSPSSFLIRSIPEDNKINVSVSYTSSGATGVCNGTTASQTGTYRAVSINLYIFARNSNGTADEFANFKLSNSKIYIGETLVRNFVPCYRKADNEVGLYDMVSQTFFTNQGTGTFAKGDNVYYLPKEYQEVSYITFDGNSYIDTNYNATTQNLQTSLETSVDYSWNGTNYGSIFATDLNAGKRYDVDTHNNGGTNAYVMGYGNSGDIVSQTLNANTKYNVNYSYVLTGQYATIYLKHNNSTIKTKSTSTYWNNIRPTANILIGAMMQSSVTNFYGGNIYSCKIYGDGILVRYFKPCYRKSDNEIGLYDCVNNVFYTNQGTGSFAKGENVYYRLPSEYQKVEWIQDTTLTQYIDTGVIPTSSLGAYIKADLTNSSRCQFGCLEQIIGTSRYARCHFGVDSNANYVYYGTSTGDTGQYTSFVGGISETTISNGLMKAKLSNGTIIQASNDNNYPSISIYLFARNFNGFNANQSTSKLYIAKFYNGNTPQRVFVPCYRKSDNEIGLYDIVNQRFYANSGTGSFTKGADDYEIIG